MNSTPIELSERLDEVIAEYLHAEEAGKAPPAAEVLAAHPDFAGELQQFFHDRQQLQGLAGGLPEESPERRFVPPKVRYFGDYELLDEIARGGMGVVYKARQTSLNRTVAIKMILSGHLASDEDVKRFKTEAEAAGNLRHPGIVAVHEVGLHEGRHYFSMDYIEGRSLAEMVRENPLPARKGAEYVQAIAGAVEYAHQQGTLHRDLKPSNVLIDADDAVHVMDFGLAARVEGDHDLTRTGQVLGTPAYMPPEQAQGKRRLIGPTSDVYSLGVILYELLTGRPPFRAESSLQTLQQVIESEPAPLRLLNPKAPRDLETICLKCLQKQPHKRYPTAAELAAELAADLRRWLNGEAIRARPVGKLERLWRWCRRNPSSTALLASVFMMLAVLFSGALWYVNDRGERQAERIRAESEDAERLARLEQGIETAINTARDRREESWSLTDRPEQWAALLSSARSAQRRAESLIEQEPDRVDPGLLAQLADLKRETSADEQDQQFAARFDAIRLEMSEVDLEKSHFKDTEAYVKTCEALAALGLHIGRTPVSEAAALIRDRPAAARETRISSLDLCLRYVPRNDFESRKWILSVLNAVDSDPWRSEVRQALVARDEAELQRLAGDADVAAHPTTLLISAARTLFESGQVADSMTLLMRLHFERADDFWINYWIGRLLLSKELNDPELAARYYQAAVAVRPENAGMWLNFGVALSRAGETDRALAAYQRAIALAPEYAAAHVNAGNIHNRLGDDAAAIAAFRTAAELQPSYAPAHWTLGRALRRSGDPSAAIAAFQNAWELDRGNKEFQVGFLETCLEAGESQTALDALWNRLDADRVSSNDYFLLAQFCRFTGDVSGYRKVCRQMFDKFSASGRSHRHTLLTACLSFPEAEVTPELLAVAQTHGNSRVRIYRRMLGLAYYRLGRDREALEILEATADEDRTANSRLGSLLSVALVQLRLGQLDAARETIQAAHTTAEDSTWDETPWSVGASLWREVQAAMEVAGVDEAIPALPPTYSEWPTATRRDADREGA